MQDAFLKVWERWDRVGPMDSPEGYLFQTAMNLYRSRLRRMVVAVRRTIRVLPATTPSRPWRSATRSCARWAR